MNKRTPGEKVFEEYLASQGFVDVPFEKLPEGKTKPPDYTITLDRDYYFDVKDFDPVPINPGFGFYDPYERIRRKIDEARKKFQEYMGEPCSLVLFNNGNPLVD